MIEALVITLREGIEAALVLGIILAYLNKTGRSHLAKQAYRGLAAAIAASVVFAVTLQMLGIDPENEYMEGALLTTAGIMVASLVFWMWRTARNLKAGIESKLENLAGSQEGKGHGWGLLAFIFVMVFREGAETVLFLMGATMGRFSLLSFIGGAIGVSLAVLFAVLFIRGSLRVNLGRFFRVSGIVLLVLALKLLLGGLHEFAEVGVIPMTKGAMAFIGYFVRDESSMVILMALLAVPLLVILWDARSPGLTEGEESAVQRRKRLAARRAEGFWRMGLVGAASFVLLAMGSSLVAGSGFVELKPTPISSSGGTVSVALSSLSEGELAKYVYQSNGAGVRFLVLKLADGSVAVAFDACQICGAVGYGRMGEEALCLNCNAPIPQETIGQGGGCNPLQLAFSIVDGAVSIPVTELAKAESRFRAAA